MEFLIKLWLPSLSCNLEPIYLVKLSLCFQHCWNEWMIFFCLITLWTWSSLATYCDIVYLWSVMLQWQLLTVQTVNGLMGDFRRHCFRLFNWKWAGCVTWDVIPRITTMCLCRTRIILNPEVNHCNCHKRRERQRDLLGLKIKLIA